MVFSSVIVTWKRKICKQKSNLGRNKNVGIFSTILYYTI